MKILNGKLSISTGPLSTTSNKSPEGNMNEPLLCRFSIGFWTRKNPEICEEKVVKPVKRKRPGPWCFAVAAR